MILDRVHTIDNLDDHLASSTIHQEITVVPKKAIKKSEIVSFDGVEPDFMIFVEKDNLKACHLVELKDGCAFDTKSSAAEKEHLHEFIRKNAQKLQYTFEGHICCFNEQSREGIIKGFKNKITDEDALTGREFCELLQIDYDEIVNTCSKDRNENLQFFINNLIKDEKILKELQKII